MKRNWHKVFDIREGKFTFDFRLFDHEEGHHGMCFPSRYLVLIYMFGFESLDHMISIITHESLHCALHREELEDEEEHDIIRWLQWGIDDMW